MHQKQCPRCGTVIPANQRMHWPCVWARMRQKLLLPVGGTAGAVVVVLVGIGIVTGKTTQVEVVVATNTPLAQIAQEPSQVPTDETHQPTVSPTALNSSECKVSALTTSRTNMRSSPSTSSPVMAVMTQASQMTVSEYALDNNDAKWWHLKNNFLWVIETSVSETGNCDAVPLAQAQTASSGVTTAKPTQTSSSVITTKPTQTPTVTRTPTTLPSPTKIRPTQKPGVTALTGTIKTTKLNIRLGPGPEYQSVFIASQGQSFRLIGRNEEATWVQIDDYSAEWANADLLNVNGDIRNLPVTFIEKGVWGPPGKPIGVKGLALTVLRLRGGPGEDYKQLENPDTLNKGKTVDIVGKSVDGKWYQVNVNGRSAWVQADPSAIRVQGNMSIIPETETR